MVFLAPKDKHVAQERDGAPRVPCSTVFKNAALLLGAASCAWSDARTLQVSLGIAATVTATTRRTCAEPLGARSDQLVVHPGVAIGAPKGRAGNHIDCVPVHPPTSALPPRIFVQFARQIGQCDKTIVFDAGAMRSIYGSRNTSFSWALSSRNTSGALLPLKATTRIALNESLLRVPREAFVGRAAAVASLTVTTFLGASSTATYTTLIYNSTALPEIRIQNPSPVRRRHASRIVATASLPTCAGASAPAFDFRWFVRVVEERGVSSRALHNEFDWVEIDATNISEKEDAFISPGGFHFADKRRATLLAKPFTWCPCVEYEMKAMVQFASADNDPVSNFQTTLVQQAHGQVRAIIDLLNTTISPGQPLMLDASSSYDEDGLAPQVNLTFAWSCMNLTEGTPCHVQGVPSWTSDTLQLPAGALPTGSRVKFMVTVSSDAHPVFPCYPEEARQSTDWAFVVVASIPTPDVRVQVCATPSCEEPMPVIQERVVVNFRPGQSYYLHMSADMPAREHKHGQAAAECGNALESHWSSSIVPTCIDTASLTRQHSLPLSGVEIFKFTLKDRLSATMDAGYRFQIEVSTECNFDGALVPSISDVEINVDINPPPQSGRLVVTPMETSKPTAATTLFHLHHAEKWVDVHFPLLYHFAFVVGDWDAGAFNSQIDNMVTEHPNLIYLEEFSRMSDSLYTMLPVPGQCPHREITVMVQVSDSCRTTPI